MQKMKNISKNAQKTRNAKNYYGKAFQMIIKIYFNRIKFAQIHYVKTGLFSE